MLAVRQHHATTLVCFIFQNQSGVLNLLAGHAAARMLSVAVLLSPVFSFMGFGAEKLFAVCMDI